MDAEEIKQYRGLVIEADHLRRRRENLQERKRKWMENGRYSAVSDTVQAGDILTGHRKVTGNGRDAEQLETDILESETLLRIRMISSMTRIRKIEKAIDSIPDALTRTVFRIWIIEGAQSWQQVAEEMKGGNTADAMRSVYNRGLEKYFKNPIKRGRKRK